MAQFELQPSNSPPSYSSTFGVTSPTRNLCPRCTQARQGNPEEEPIPGWPKLAKLITDNPGLEAFPSFRDLNIKSLLYYQAELDGLRDKLKEREWKDHKSLQELGEIERLDSLNRGERVDHLLECKYEQDKEARAQYDLIIEIRAVLKEYNEALIQYSQITAFPKAESLNVKALRTCLKDRKLVDREISGPGTRSWSDITTSTSDSQKTPLIGQRFLHLLCSLFWSNKPEENKLDLIVPRSGHAVDGLTRWVATEWISFLVDFRKWRKARKTPHPDPESRIPNAGQNNTLSLEPTCACKKVSTLNTFSERRMLQFTSSVATIVACVLPIAAITVLSKLHTNSEVLGIIALFTVAFAGGLMFLSGGTSRVDIFTATAAFSAVMVVFVQNQNGGSYPQGVGAQ